MLSIAILAAVLVLYIGYAVTVRFMGEKSIIAMILAILNFAAHLGLFVICAYLKASLQEILFILVVSASIAITVTRHGKEEQ